MLLFPKNAKFKKSFSRKTPSFTVKSSPTFVSGDFGLVTIENGKINNRQLESVRRILKRSLKSYGKGWLKPFPNIPVTKKPEEARMGKGKANVKLWSAFVNKGDVIIEIKGCSWSHAKKVFSQVKPKLSVKTYLKLNRNF